jgi:uncharacterized membrane protein|tara:strand:+ start:2976 stop:3590 length:615 start_codon:yes stop_codon:yes gene_type:complete
MSAILSSLRNTIISGLILSLLLLLTFYNWGTVDSSSLTDQAFYSFVFRWLHVLAAIMWIGLLWYFNFVQIPNMPNIPDNQKPAISKVIAPAALWWFRWAAMATVFTGLVLGYLNGYLESAMTLGFRGDGLPQHIAIGVGMWLGIVMWFNVWFVIWPNQKKALGIVKVEDSVKAASARTAMLFSRTNTLLSIPMIFSMVAAQNLF